MRGITISIKGENGEEVKWEIPYHEDIELQLYLAVTDYYEYVVKKILKYRYGFTEDELENITLTYYQDAFMVTKGNKVYIITFVEYKNGWAVYKHPEELVVEIYETE